MKKYLLLVVIFLAIPSLTLAFYADIETLITNSLSTASLDLVLGNPSQSNTDSKVDLSKTSSSSDLKYQVSFSAIGSTSFCSQYSLKIILNSSTLYSGSLISLSNFSVPEFTIIGSSVHQLVFAYSLPPDLSSEFQSLTCDFNYLFTAWDKDFSDSATGFTDTEEQSISLSSPSLPTPTPTSEPLPTSTFTPTPTLTPTSTPTLTPSPTPDSSQCGHENSECQWNLSTHDCCPGLICAEWRITGGVQRYKCDVPTPTATTTSSPTPLPI